MIDNYNLSNYLKSRIRGILREDSPRYQSATRAEFSWGDDNKKIERSRSPFNIQLNEKHVRLHKKSNRILGFQAGAKKLQISEIKHENPAENSLMKNMPTSSRKKRKILYQQYQKEELNSCPIVITLPVLKGEFISSTNRPFQGSWPTFNEQHLDKERSTAKFFDSSSKMKPSNGACRTLSTRAASSAVLPLSNSIVVLVFG